MTQATSESMKLSREAATDSGERCTAIVPDAQTNRVQVEMHQAPPVWQVLVQRCSFRSQSCQRQELSCGLTRYKSRRVAANLALISYLTIRPSFLPRSG